MNHSEEEPSSILIDVTFLFDQYAGRGHGRYGKELLRRMLKLIIDSSWSVHLIGYHDLEKNLMQLKFTSLGIEEIKRNIHFTSLGDPRISGISNLFRWKKDFAEAINKIEPSVFFATHFERGLPTHPRFSKMLNDVPITVVTVHDVIPMVMGTYSRNPIKNFFKEKFYKNLFRGVRSSDLVLTPSNFSKDDLVAVGGVSEGLVKVTYLGIDSMFYVSAYDEERSVEQAILEKFELGGVQYFFYDSGIEQNKGVTELLTILHSYFALEKHILTRLVVTAGSDLEAGRGEEISAKTKLGKDFIEKAKELDILDRISVVGRVSDQELVILLHNASAYVYLSNYEGFGFGPLQAMASEVPAFVANRSCLPEITNGGAILLETEQVSESAEQIHEILINEDKREAIVAKGKEVVEAYSWENTAKVTWEAILVAANDAKTLS